MAYGDPPGSFPWLPQVMATPEGWVRLDEAGHAVSAPIMERIERELADPLIGRVMSRSEPQTIVWSDVVDFSDWGKDEPAADIMSVVRAVARGS